MLKPVQNKESGLLQLVKPRYVRKLIETFKGPIPSLSDREDPSKKNFLNFVPDVEPRVLPKKDKLGGGSSSFGIKTEILPEVIVTAKKDNMFSKWRNKLVSVGIPILIFLMLIGMTIKALRKK